MLTSDEIKYLSSIPNSRTVHIESYDPNIKIAAEKIIEEVKNIFNNVQVLFLGASALEIAGQNDIDLYLLVSPKDFQEYVTGLNTLFGEPAHKANSFIEWNFVRQGFDVEFYISDPETKSMKRQVEVFNILKENLKLAKDYEKLKLSFNNKKYRDYQKAKYEFYNKILGNENI